MNARLELAAVVMGMMLLALGAAAYDWRLGLLALGVLLIISAVDFRGVRK